MTYPIVEVDPGSAVAPEQMGTKRKYWFRQGEARVLFKADDRGTGEDWAEKVACELAALMGLPHVKYELAIEVGTGRPGVVCESCAPRPLALVPGNQLLFALDRDYPTGGRRFKVTAHTVEAVSRVVGLLAPPRDWMHESPPVVATAHEVFAGYALLDALTANQDRHHENWSALWDQKRLVLAPTFDHGAALARNLADEERERRLATTDMRQAIPAFVRRARSAFYGGEGALRALTTVETWQAFRALAPQGAAAWLRRLEGMNEAQIEEILEKIPAVRMTPVCRTFTLALLQENRRRLLADEPA